MKKTKFVAVILMLCIIVSIGLNSVFVNSVNAETIKITQSVTGTDGSVEFAITNLELENNASYEWAIEKTKGGTIENWYSVLAPDYDNGKINITVSAKTGKQLSVLKSVDDAYLSLRKVGEDTKIIDEYKVSLRLPLSKAITIKNQPTRSLSGTGFDIETTVYGIKKTSVQYLWEEITDSDIINNYIDREHDISGLNLKGKDDFPSSNNTTWKTATVEFAEVNILQPSKEGLYYLWLKGSSDDVKTVYGMTVVEIGTVKKISNNTENTTKTKENENSEKLDSKNLIGFPMLVFGGERNNLYI